jgi:acetyl esterase
MMDVYAPESGGPFPALVAIHGGGFVGGARTDMEPVALFFANNGYAVFTIDYRVAPAFPYPAAVEDAQTAVRFIREQAGSFGVDPARVGALGGSAGGTIAASLSAAGDDPASDAGIAAAVSWSGALDLAATIAARPNNPRVLENLTGYVGMPGADPTSPEVQAALAAASPINQVGPGDPPMFVANAVQEVMPLAQAQAYVDTLEDLDIPHELLTPAQGHAMQYAREASPPTLDFLDQFLRGFQGGTTPPTSTPPTTSDPGEGRDWLTVAIVGGMAVLVVALLAGPVVTAFRRRRPRY